MTAILNQIAEKWFSWQLAMFWQVGVLIVIVAGLDLIIKKWAWPQVRYALWLLILVKLILPPSLTSPTSFTAEIPFMVKQAAVKINQPQISQQIIKQTEPVMSPDIESKPSEVVVKPAIIIPASPVPIADASLLWKSYVLFVWLGGVVILSGWLVVRLSNLRREHLKGQSNLPQRLEELLVSTARKLGLKRVPQIILTNKVCCPAVFGVFRPVLLMPADKLQNLTMQDAENIFLHELAHIKRGDLLAHAVYMILQIAYWFNPLIWLIRKHLQNLCELCCDATVARMLREKTAGYRQTLLETARQLLAQPVDPGLGLLGLFENSSWLVDRLRWLEKKSWRYRPLRIATVFVLICLMSACVLPMAKFEVPADFVIKGTVTDAQTGKPIAGARVGDVEKYAEGKQFTTTNENGNYSYKTYYEEHGVKAEADGYKRQNKGFGTKLFGREKEKIINFALEPNETSEKEKLQNLVEDFFKDNYRDIKQRKTIEWGEPIIELNGNQTIRYKYEANIWGSKDRYIFNELFTFNKENKYVSSKKISMILKDYPADNKSSAEKIANLIDFEITKQAFLPGDSIEITEIRGSTDKIEPGQTYTIKGKYKLSSADEAMLHIYATNGQIHSEQGPVVKRGTGDFARTFTYEREGWLHLSFYPTYGGSGFGNLYFAQKGSGQKIPDISTITSIGETPKSAGAKNIDVYIADLQIKPYEAGGLYTLTVKIGNRGSATAPEFRLNFYRGDPKDNLSLYGKPLSGSHGAGPIKPGEFWNEQSLPFELKKGTNQLTVVLDTDNSIAETNKLNNSAEMKILFKNGKIIGKPTEQEK